MSITRNREVTLSAVMLAGALEVMKIIENRYSGVPTIRREMERYGLAEPDWTPQSLNEDLENLLLFCQTLWTRQEVCGFLGLSTVSYAIQTHIMPLVKQNLIKLSLPDKPGSSRQLFIQIPN